MSKKPKSLDTKEKNTWCPGCLNFTTLAALKKVLRKLDEEKKINLDDDYIKFIRFAEYLIEKNGEGVIGMITNNSYLDGVTHRQMRKKLLESFDSIYILNLHGNSKKREVAPDGERDENVFNIQQGVAIAIFIRKSKTKKGLGSVYYSDLYGKRDYKFNELNKGSFKKTKWEKLNYKEPYFFFVPKNFALEEEYNKGFSVKDIFNEYNSGIQTKRDNTTIHFTEKEIVAVINDFQILTESEIRTKYHLPEDGRDWKICFATYRSVSASRIWIFHLLFPRWRRLPSLMSLPPPTIQPAHSYPSWAQALTIISFHQQLIASSDGENFLLPILHTSRKFPRAHSRQFLSF